MKKEQEKEESYVHFSREILTLEEYDAISKNVWKEPDEALRDTERIAKSDNETWK